MGREQRANATRRAAIHRVAEILTGRAVDDGQIIALGYAAFIAQSYPNWETMSADQRDQLRTAFYAGAQHLHGSIFNMLDPGSDEPSERDMRRMTLIAHELNTFIDELKQRHNITDPDVGPPPETKQ